MSSIGSTPNSINSSIGSIRLPVDTSQTHSVSFGPVAWFLLLLLGPLPLLIKLGHYLWDREQYQFYPVLLLGAAFCGWERWQEAKPLRTTQRLASWLMLGVSLLVLLAGVLLMIRLLAGVAAIVLLAGVALRVGGWRLVRKMLPIGALLATIVPPPWRQQQWITLKLQQFAVVWSSHLLDALHVPLMRGGDVLNIPGRQLLIEQACSGINSLMSVLAFSVLWGVWKRRSIWRIVTLLPAAVMFVVAGNIARITLDAWLKVRWNIDVLEGTPHELLGLLLFVVCLAVTLSFDGVIGLLSRERDGTKARAVKAVQNPIAGPSFQRKLGLIDWGIAIIFVVVGIGSEARVGSAWAAPSLGKEARFDLPQEIAGWVRVNHDASIVERPQTQGSQSNLWQFRRGGLIATVAIDWPFNGYHELTTCYGISGWTLIKRVDEPGVIQVAMTRPPGLSGLLEFTEVDEQGEWIGLSPPALEKGWKLDVANAARYGREPPSYQMQTLINSYNPLTDEQRHSMDALFKASRDELRRQVLTQVAGGAGGLQSGSSLSKGVGSRSGK